MFTTHATFNTSNSHYLHLELQRAELAHFVEMVRTGWQLGYTVQSFNDKVQEYLACISMHRTAMSAYPNDVSTCVQNLRSITDMVWRQTADLSGTRTFDSPTARMAAQDGHLVVR